MRIQGGEVGGDSGLSHAAISVLGSGQPILSDRRLRDLRHTDENFCFPTFENREAWLKRAAQLRRRILVAAGLSPMPPRTPLNARSWGHLECDGYTVEKVAFESFPGFYVTGNLYRPGSQTAGKRYPAVLNPHGHWPRGRLEDEARGSVPARCITFARHGFVAFSFDMIGYLDSRQVDHRSFGGLREWLWSIHPLGLQLWNSIRSLDYLIERPDVESDQIACTGASGGGTQTFLLTAVDDRVRVSAPVNMVSAQMQGGCVCENAPGLRLDTYNVEIAALAAPRPLLLVSATGDWTVNTPSVEFPAIQSVYRLLGAEGAVENVQIDAGHNYNLESREAVYAFFSRQMESFSVEETIRETPYRLQEDSELRVFPDGGQLPDGALDPEGIVGSLKERACSQLSDLWPCNARQADEFREHLGAAFADVLAAEPPRAEEIYIHKRARSRTTEYRVEQLVIGRQINGCALTAAPALYLSPLGISDPIHASPPVLMVHGEGKAAFFQQDGDVVRPGPLAAMILHNGRNILTLDTFLTGEYASLVSSSGRPALEPHFTTFNRTDAQWRVHDVVTGVAALRRLSGAPGIDIVGLDDAGLWCLLARTVIASSIRRLAVDMADFSRDRDEDYLERLFVPGLRRLGDVATAIAISAPAPLLLHRQSDAAFGSKLMDLYASLGKPSALQIYLTGVADSNLCAWLEGV